MKKPVVIGITAVVIVAAIIIGVVAMSGKDDDTSKSDKKTTTSATTKDGYKLVGACDVLTESIGKKTAGDNATSTPSDDTKTDSINVSNCTYYGSKGVAALLARSALNKEGADSNAQQFKTLPEGAVKVDGLGESAYWAPQYAQLNVLKNNNWYIISAGPAQVSQRTVDQSKALANEIISKL
jgi:hypothetical protein